MEVGAKGGARRFRIESHLASLGLSSALLLMVLGCGAPAPEHAEKPMSAPVPRSASAFDKLTTAEAKIDYIQKSKAPESEKKEAIEMIKSGRM